MTKRLERLQRCQKTVEIFLSNKQTAEREHVIKQALKWHDKLV